MKPLPAALFTAAAIALAGACAAAKAPPAKIHVMTVRLPGGGVEEIRYTGDVAPGVVFAPFAAGPRVASPFVYSPFGVAFGPVGYDPSPFAAMDRISAEMDREAATLFAQVRAMEVGATQAPAFAGGLPAGGRGFSFASSASGSGFCMRSVEIISQGQGREPKVVTHTAGDCGGSSAAPGPVTHPAPAAAASRSGLVQTAYHPTAKPPVPPATAVQD